MKVTKEVTPWNRKLMSIGEGDGKDGDDGGDGGGSGGSGSEKFGDEEKKWISQQVNRTIHKALTDHLGRSSFQESLGQVVQRTVEGVLKSAPANDRSERSDKSDKSDPEREAQAKRITELEAKLKAQDEEREATRRRERRSQEREAIKAALQKVGVPPSRLRGAVAMVMEDGIVARTSDDRIIVKQQRDGYADELEPGRWAEEWAKSDEGKEWLPPVNAGGSGNTGGRPALGNSSGKRTQAEMLQQLGRHLMGETE